MSRRCDRNAEAMRKVEDALRAEGRAFEADAIARLRRSAAQAVNTLKTIYRDNMELRQRLGLSSFLDENQKTEGR